MESKAKSNTRKSTNEKFIDYICMEKPPIGWEEEIWNELFEINYSEKNASTTF